MTFAQGDDKEFKLYLLPPDVKAAGLSRLNINKIKPFGKPFLTTKDIRFYVKDSHELMIDYTAAPRLKSLKVPVSGRPFIVFVGDQPIYTGAFWTGFSSVSFRGVAVDVSKLTGDFPNIKLDLDYPPLAPKNTGFDPRSDPRVFEVFEKAGVLYEQVWMWGKCTKIEGSGKHRPSFYFTFDVTSVVKSTYDSSTVNFELFDPEYSKLMQAINVGFDGRLYAERNWRFDTEKEILLKFERLVSNKTPGMHLRTFTTK